MYQPLASHRCSLHEERQHTHAPAAGACNHYLTSCFWKVQWLAARGKTRVPQETFKPTSASTHLLLAGEAAGAGILYQQ